jgi:hypothetical protein
MPLPIKLTAGGKVITKVVNGVTRISCECCEEPQPTPECCFYPIESLGTGFLEEDLPEEGIFYHNNTGPLSGPFTLQRNSGSGTLGEKLLYGSFGNFNLGGRAIYYFPAVPDEYHRRQDQIDPGGGRCLFDDRFDEENGPAPAQGPGRSIWWFDNFKDTYTISAYSKPYASLGADPPEFTQEVHRVSLCEWKPLEEDFPILYYTTFAGAVSDRRNMWVLDFYLRIDGGPYNSPAGEYGGISYDYIVS